jgi:hypothetical protein
MPSARAFIAGTPPAEIPSVFSQSWQHVLQTSHPVYWWAGAHLAVAVCGVRNSAGRRMAVPRDRQTLVMDMQDRQQPLRARSPCTARRRDSKPFCVVTQRTQRTSQVGILVAISTPPPPPPLTPRKDRAPSHCHTSCSAEGNAPPGHSSHPVPRLLCPLPNVHAASAQ